MRIFKTSLPTVAILFLSAICLSLKSEAQNLAKVEKIQRTVEKQSGTATTWGKAPSGTDLSTGERVRTGKRSKADVRFADKSLLRLGQLSRLELRGQREVRLTQGELLFSALSPARILAGSATAAIKGTVPLVRVHPNGDVEFALYSGELEITTDAGSVTLRPGQWVKVYANGQFSPVKTVTPLYFINGTARLGLLFAPRDEPFVGSDAELRLREDPSRQLFDSAATNTNPVATNPRYNPFTYSQNNPLIPPRPTPTPEPTPTVTPTEEPTPEPTPTEEPTPTPEPTPTEEPTPTPTEEPTPTPEPTPTEEPTPEPTATETPTPTPEPTVTPTPGGRNRNRNKTNYFRGALVGTGALAFLNEFGKKPKPPVEDPNFVDISDGPERTLRPASTGEEHLLDVDPTLGSATEFDVRALSAFSSGDGGGRFFANRLALSGTRGQSYYNVALVPLQLRQNGDTRSTAIISQALVMFRTQKADWTIGRQLIWDGPMQASLWGSMLRQGGRNTFDAVRVTTHLNQSLNFDLGYLYDAYPNLLNTNVPGQQKGYFGRAEWRTSKLALGVNLLRYKDTFTESTSGTTMDFVLPLAQDSVEFYGELGRDPFRRNTRAFGLNFPALYDKAGIDLFIESAKVGNSSSGLAPNREFAARMYKDIGSNKKLMLAFSKFSGSDTRFLVGFTIGGHGTLRDQSLTNLLAR